MDRVRREFEAALGMRDHPPGADGFIDRGAFEQQLSRADYVIFAYPNRSYRFTASGALLDALAFARPVIALRNPYFEHVDQIAPGFITFCKDERDFADRIVDCAVRGRDAEYRARVEALVSTRHVVAHSSLVQSFAGLFLP